MSHPIRSLLERMGLVRTEGERAHRYEETDRVIEDATNEANEAKEARRRRQRLQIEVDANTVRRQSEVHR